MGNPPEMVADRTPGSASTGEDAVVESVELLRFVSGEFWIGSQQQYVVAIEPEILAVEVLNRPQKQTGDSEQDEREHDLCGDESFGKQTSCP